MKFLIEREAGFDTDRLGFPSISGCLAICYLTHTGIFGFHNAGGSRTDEFSARAKLFGDYVKSIEPHPKGVQLYGCSFVGDNRRGYANAKDWKTEMKAFAKALNFGGPISGCDLAAMNIAESAYVEYRRVGMLCYIFAKAWSDANRVTAANPADPNHQCLRGNQYGQVITSVDVTGLTALAPVKL
jgi:hypothetical protein